jgi:hypothetical protein
VNGCIQGNREGIRHVYRLLNNVTYQTIFVVVCEIDISVEGISFPPMGSGMPLI